MELSLATSFDLKVSIIKIQENKSMWYKYSRGLLTNPIPYLSKKFSPITYLNNERDKFSRKIDKIVNGPSTPSYNYQPQNNQRYQAQPFQQPFQNQQEKLI